MSAPKATEAAVVAVQQALGCERDTFAGYYCAGACQVRWPDAEWVAAEWTERGCEVAVAAADAAAPHIAAQTLRDAGASVMGKHDEDAERGIITRPTWARVAAWLSARAGRIEADA